MNVKRAVTLTVFSVLILFQFIPESQNKPYNIVRSLEYDEESFSGSKETKTIYDTVKEEISNYFPETVFERGSANPQDMDKEELILFCEKFLNASFDIWPWLFKTREGVDLQLLLIDGQTRSIDLDVVEKAKNIKQLKKKIPSMCKELSEKAHNSSSEEGIYE